jgi:hypothetical protein
MLSSFTFYDLVGYLMPGGTILGLGYWLNSTVLHLSFALKAPGGDLVAGAVLLGLSYVVGHVVQRIGYYAERGIVYGFWHGARSPEPEGRRLVTFGGAGSYFANQLLSEAADEKDWAYPASTRRLIRDCAQRVFGLPDTATPKQLFDLCQTVAPASMSPGRAATYLGISGLARGMGVASLAAVAVSVFIGGRAWWITGMPLASKEAWVVLLVFGVSIFLWYKAFRHFAWYFADSVWMNFVAWSLRDASGIDPAPRMSFLGWFRG